MATLIERKIRFIAIKEAIEVEGKQDPIAKILDVSRSALYHFIETRKIGPG